MNNVHVQNIHIVDKQTHKNFTQARMCIVSPSPLWMIPSASSFQWICILGKNTDQIIVAQDTFIQFNIRTSKKTISTLKQIKWE